MGRRSYLLLLLMASLPFASLYGAPARGIELLRRGLTGHAGSWGFASMKMCWAVAGTIIKFEAKKSSNPPADSRSPRHDLLNPPLMKTTLATTSPSPTTPTSASPARNPSGSTPPAPKPPFASSREYYDEHRILGDRGRDGDAAAGTGGEFMESLQQAMIGCRWISSSALVGGDTAMLQGDYQ
jgi:hypothetical protein